MPQEQVAAADPFYYLNYKPASDLSSRCDSAAAGMRSRSMSHKPANSVSVQLVACAAVGLVMAMAGLLYVSVLLSPALMRWMMKDVLICDPFLRLESSSSFSSSPPFLHTVINGTQFSFSDDRAEVSVRGNRVTVACSPCDPSTNKSLTISSTSSDGKFRIFLGILTTASKQERRNLLRMAYGVQSSAIAEIRVRFVLGNPKNEEEKAMVAMEILHHKDIILLDCEENLNAGKTYAFFYTIAQMQNERFDYAMKTDDDSYVRLENLALSLRDLPRSDLYYGYILPCENSDPYSWYMAGMGYILSWDLVEWIKTSAIAREKRVGTEDQLVAEWLNAGGKAKMRVNKKPLFYDHPDFGGKCAHALIPETILIHQVKTPQRWLEVLSFFEKDRFNITPAIPVQAISSHHS